tara:strand:- start:7960 stop:10980 length:3021 start_codon:yes stop_codon:yes gene_type:complete
MSVGKKSGIKYPFTQGDFDISVLSTKGIRDALLAKNLDGSYLNRGNPIPPNGDQQPGSVVVGYQTWSSVKDSPLPEEVTDLNGIPLKETQFLANKYGPQEGYGDPLSVNVVNLVREAQLQYVSPNTLQPQGFVPGLSFDNFSYSNYTAIEIMQSINSNNGQLVTINSAVLDDSELIRSSFPYLKDNLGFNLAKFDFNISEDGDATLNVTTSPGELIPPKSDYLSRLEGVYPHCDSPIPGNYFLPVNPLDINSIAGQDANNISQTSMVAQATNILNSIWNGLSNWNPLPNTPMSVPAPSDKFIEYMGKDQQSELFDGLNYNRYRPDYTRVQVDTSVEAPLANYYVGSKNTEPNLIQSPIEATPKDVFGRQVRALVYGPSEVYKEFDNVDGRALWRYYNFGPLGRALIDGGTIEGGFTWFGKNSISSGEQSMMFFSTRSDLKPKKKGSLLDYTQKLMDSAPSYGGAKWKHAGNAIDQVSKVFNDGYKNISKGSRVIDFVPGEVVWNCVQYCRAWTKDRPYSKYSDLVKSGGNQWKNTNSILDSTFNLNIAPTNLDGGKSTSMPEGTKVKKYMFSVENLSWRGTGEQSNLPASEKGPNGGRVMWFPPYDVQVGDTNSASWSSTNFLGRPEPIYTYNHTERLGTLSWKMVVDHPSIMNAIIDRQLKGMPDAEADAVLESFFAGCRKYDIYQLAEQYPNLSFDFISAIQVAVAGGSKEVTDDIRLDATNTVVDNDSSEEDMGGHLTEKEAETIETNQNADAESGHLNVENVNQGTVNDGFRIGFTDKRATMTSIIRRLLGEANYFTFLREQYPFLYQSIRDNLKFFHPGFHSMTPEGLNSRLTFLLQCLRPGKTIPTVTEQGTTMIDADNTAFGPPPVCVLRVGDFYHSKVIFDSISYSYDENTYDLNPEGIGVQPMIVSVQTNFKFVGGQGLEGPVSKLQNALSFSYFANTELYDERAQKQNISEYDVMSLDEIANNMVNLFKKPDGTTDNSTSETDSGSEGHLDEVKET